jgi:hypothetical protein
MGEFVIRLADAFGLAHGTRRARHRDIRAFGSPPRRQPGRLVSDWPRDPLMQVRDDRARHFGTVGLAAALLLPSDSQPRGTAEAMTAPRAFVSAQRRDVTASRRRPASSGGIQRHRRRGGYIPFDPHAANLMFMLISRRYERASLIVTSDKPFSAWGESSATKSPPPQ